jgi:signal transduction histidine kinase
MKRPVLFFLLVCATLPGIAQRQGQALIDSLIGEIPRPKAPRDQVVLIYRLGNLYSPINIDSALYYSRQALALSRQINWLKVLGKAYTLTGLNLYYKGDYANAMKYYDTAIELSEKAHDSLNWNMTLLNMGALTGVQGNYPKAMQYFVRCLALDEQLHDTTNKGIALQNVSNIYMQMKDTARAIDYSVEAYTTYKALGNKPGMALSLYTRGSIYDGAGQDSLSLACYQQAYQTYRQADDKEGMAKTLNGEGNLFLKKNDFSSAYADFSGGLNLSRQLGNKYESVVMELNIGDVYLSSVIAGKYTLPAIREYAPPDKRTAYLHSARDYLFQALTVNQQEKFDALKDNYLYISKLDSLTGNYRGALAAYEQYSILKDSTFNTENRQTVRELEDQRQIEVRDQQLRINQLELSRNQLAISRQNTQRWMYIGGILLLAAIGTLLYRQSRQRKKANSTLQQLNTQLDQANQVKTRLFGVLSHDLRSPIGNLISFLNLKKDNPDLLAPEQTERHQQEIDSSARNLLDTMEDLLLWSKEQMRHFSPQPHPLPVPNLFAEMRRLYPDTDRCRLDFECPPEMILVTDEHFLKTITRNLTTNALSAVTNTPHSHISWMAWEANGTKYLAITDNGPGISLRAQAILLSDDHATAGSRLGLHLVRDFAAAINCRITVDSTPEKGSRFTLAFA